MDWRKKGRKEVFVWLDMHCVKKNENNFDGEKITSIRHFLRNDFFYLFVKKGGNKNEENK